MVAMNHWVLTSEMLGTEFLHIRVGPQRIRFMFHKKLLCDLSGWFADYSKDRPGDLTLPDLEEDWVNEFQGLLNYVYRGCVPPITTEDDEVAYCQGLREIYYVAEHYRMNDLANKILDGIEPFYRQGKLRITTISTIQVYERTTEKSLLRWFFATRWALFLGRSSGKEKDSRRTEKCIAVGKKNPQFLEDLLRAKAVHSAIIKHRRTKKFGPCDFHIHGPGETCHVTGVTTPLLQDSDSQDVVIEIDEAASSSVVAEVVATEGSEIDDKGESTLETDTISFIEERKGDEQVTDPHKRQRDENGSEGVTEENDQPLKIEVLEREAPTDRELVRKRRKVRSEDDGVLTMTRDQNDTGGRSMTDEAREHDPVVKVEDVAGKKPEMCIFDGPWSSDDSAEPCLQQSTCCLPPALKLGEQPQATKEFGPVHPSRRWMFRRANS